MKIYNVTFCNDNGASADNVTVTTLREIDFPDDIYGRIDIHPDLDILVRKFLEDAFEAYMSETPDEVMVFHHFSEIESVVLFEDKYPLI